jgi:hypothetical protein
MLWGPLSESYGHKGTMVISFAILNIFSIASAVAPNFAAQVIFRLLVGVGGSCAISVVGGICADIYHNPKYCRRSMAIFMVSLPFFLYPSCTLIPPNSCDDFRPHPRPSSIRVYRRSRLELDFLDRSHIRWSNMVVLLLLQRNIWTYDSQKAG